MAKNDKKPLIRFKGFTDAWEQCKFIDIFDFEDKIYRKYNKKGQFDLQNVQVEYKSFFKLMN